MNLELMQEFVEFSRTLNVSQAAKSLFITPSCLSKHLKTIEEEIGTPLVSRKGDARLTAAGETFLEACNSILHIYDSTIVTCHKQAENTQRVSLLKPCTLDASLDAVYSIYRGMEKRHENIGVELLPMTSHSMRENLEMGRVDCATLHSTRPDVVRRCDDDGISLCPLFSDRLFIWMSSDSKLAEKEHLNINDLAGVPIYLPASRIYRDLHEWHDELFGRFGLKPWIVFKTVDDISDLMSLTLTDGVMILTSEVINGGPVVKHRTDMIARRVEDEGLENTVYLAWLTKNENPALQTLVEYVEQEFDSLGFSKHVERAAASIG